MQQQSEQLGRQDSAGPASALSTGLRLGVQRVVQERLEHDVTECLRRDQDRRGPRRLPGYRNGYKPKTLPTRAGRILVPGPQVRASAEPVQSRH